MNTDTPKPRRERKIKAPAGTLRKQRRASMRRPVRCALCGALLDTGPGPCACSTPTETPQP